MVEMQEQKFRYVYLFISSFDLGQQVIKSNEEPS